MIWRAGPALLWTITISILTLLPGKDLPKVDIVNFDKVAHLGVFFALNLLYLRWLAKNYTSKKRILSITLGCIAYGGLIEILQGTLYTDRYADIYDFIFNALGCLFALPIFYRLPAKLR
jgi:VanZ family protein